jgi:hypothetical protein
MSNVLPFTAFSKTHDSASEVQTSSSIENSSLENETVTKSELPNAASHKYLADIDALSRTALSKKYKAEYNSWRNMKQRQKKGAVIDAEFDDFRSFLRHVGPRPAENQTLDRIDNKNPKYGPGLVRWADKTTQNNNRSNSIHLVDADGTTRPLTEWAEITGQRADTLRQRLRNGWTDTEVIHGREPESDRSLNVTPWPLGEKRQWEKLYQKHRAAGRLLADEKRLDFMFRISRERMIIKTQELEVLQLEQSYRDLSEAELDKLTALEASVTKFRQYLDFVPQKRADLARRKKIASYRGEYGSKVESDLSRRYGPRG